MEKANGVAPSGIVETDEQAAARRRLRKFATDREKTAKAEVDSIVDALLLGVRQVDVVRDVDRSREYVRRIARDAEAAGQLPPRSTE